MLDHRKNERGMSSGQVPWTLALPIEILLCFLHYMFIYVQFLYICTFSSLIILLEICSADTSHPHILPSESSVSSGLPSSACF